MTPAALGAGVIGGVQSAIPAARSLEGALGGRLAGGAWPSMKGETNRHRLFGVVVGSSSEMRKGK